jgi:cell division septal protein FtsQ
MPEYHSYSGNKTRKSPELQTARTERVERPRIPNRKPTQSHKNAKATTRRGSIKIDGVSTERTRRKFRKSYVLHYSLVAILLVSIFAALSATVLFNVRNVIVQNEGLQMYSYEEILLAGNIEEGLNLMRFDSVQARTDIMSALVQLDGVQVTRVFPSTITITAQNAERVFSLYENRTYWEISRNGRVINSGSNRPDGLVVTGFTQSDSSALRVGGNLTCPENESEDSAADTERAELIFRLADLVEHHDFEVSRIDVSDRFDVKLYYGDGAGSADGERIEIRLGMPTQLSEKIMIAKTIVADEIDSNESGVLRVTSRQRASFNPN